jgi:endogenous inhibitor of DNA gyrase (YacG/DUF329 family)
MSAVAHEIRSARQMRCPRYGLRRAWAGNPHRPFCSLARRLIDLGDWLDERYRVAGPELSIESEPPESGAPRVG